MIAVFEVNLELNIILTSLNSMAERIFSFCFPSIIPHVEGEVLTATFSRFAMFQFYRIELP